MHLENKRVTTIKDTRNLTLFFKGIAILLVILVHSHQRFNLSNTQNAIQRFGQMGCQIFFVLSSFGLCHSFSNETPSWLSHMKKRLSKLAIGYWGAILFTALYRILLALVSQKEILPSLNIPGIIANILFLNGLIPIGGINNSIVRGGWYVGTTVLLYALFPLLYKIYFMSKNTWVKYRVFLFPITIFIVTATIVIISGFIHPSLACGNNSFVYFSFINQLLPFSLGLVLFDLINRYDKIKFALYYSIALFFISIILFFGNYKYSFVFCQSFVAAAFMLLYWYLANNQKFYSIINNSSNKITRIIKNFGALSYPIYLTHPFIVYEFSAICLTILRRICNIDLLWYLLLLPIIFYLSYVVGHVFHKCILHTKTLTKTAR